MLLKTIMTTEPRNNLVVIIEGIFVTADVCIGFWVCDLRRIFFFIQTRSNKPSLPAWCDMGQSDTLGIFTNLVFRGSKHDASSSVK